MAPAWHFTCVRLSSCALALDAERHVGTDLFMKATVVDGLVKLENVPENGWFYLMRTLCFSAILIVSVLPN